MKKNIIYLLLLILWVIAACNIRDKLNKVSNELNVYKEYYKASEDLYDEIEEDNVDYFDSDKGQIYLRVRDKIKL